MSAKPLNHTYFMMIKTMPLWLQLKPKERFQYLGTVIEPLLKRHPLVKMRFFDSEAFHARFTDVVMWETSDVKVYQFLVEELRETLFWGTYFEIVEIVPTIEDAYAAYYEAEAQTIQK
jgi:hypothetical protein